MSTSFPWRRWVGKQSHRLLALSTLAALAGYSGSTRAAEDPKCLSPNPADWPPSARPFFMIAFDTSASMVACTSQANTNNGNGLKQCNTNTPTSAFNSCGLLPNRINDGKCALRKMVQAFGEVDFGLMSFPFAAACSGPDASCGPYSNVDGAIPNEKTGPGDRCVLTTNGTNLNCPSPGTGGKLLVGLPPFEDLGKPSKILDYVDDTCKTGDPVELMPVGGTPLNGLLSDAGKYIQSKINDLQPSCRPINIILITDGEESCDNSAPNLAATTAASLFAAAAIPGRSIKVYPVGLGGLQQAGVTALEAIADAGQCASADNACKAKVGALFANNESELSIALSKIISGAISPEVCDNVDNNCNGCTDEGTQRFCNRGKTAGAACCGWSNQNSRNGCIAAYQATVTVNNPQGDLTKLPCWDPAANNPIEPEKAWLCVNPGEVCDDVDNNCDVSVAVADLAQNAIDEGFKKCGAPARCPAAEDTCIPGVTQGIDDDCDGLIDNIKNTSTPGNACGNCPTFSQEVCDGKDNDCDGNVDNGVPEIPCGPVSGPATPPNCKGTLKCVNGAYSNKCDISPEPELCDGLDNDCDGKVDNGAPGSPCEVPGKPGLIYQDDGFPDSQCKKGTIACNAPASACGGFVGPSAEICDGIDNDCDGQIDEEDNGPLPGVGVKCGENKGACTEGKRACIGGKFVCTGGLQPQPEMCNGIDDDCDGQIDNQPLVDAPPPEQSSCWTVGTDGCDPANICPNPTGGPDWCKPAGADCGGVGTLQTPCAVGNLACQKVNDSFVYACKGGLPPGAEICDGVDNDCNGAKDDGLDITPEPCDNGCGQGTKQCIDGQVSCSTGTPQVEVCDNKDNNCDGKIDEGVVQACSTACGSGVQVCNAGVFGDCSAPAPSAEVCDGLDNDCDGKTDENEDLDGSADPNNPGNIIGAKCGEEKGQCSQGLWKCIGGLVQCVGVTPPQPEVCDGLDNDCDGVIDNNPSASEPICGKDNSQACVKIAGGSAQCASKCSPGEFPCPAGNYTCQLVDGSSPGVTKGEFCVQPSGCNQCETQTLKQTVNGIEVVLCGPSSAPGASPVPQCVCKDNKCDTPCAGVLCQSPLVCSDFGDLAGSCVENSCFTIPCVGGKACNDNGECVDNPCKADSCLPTEVCKPSADLTKPECKKSCADVTCKDTEACFDGECKPTTCPKDGCGDGKVCDTTKGACVDSPCKGCRVGQVCNPTTSACEAPLCSGVVCPSGQRCDDGQCVKAPSSGAGGAGGAGGTGGSAGAGGSAGTGVVAGTGGSAGTGVVAGAGGSAGTGGTGTSTGGSTSSAGGNVTTATTPIGLTTGGGGCTCTTGVGRSEATGALSLLLAMLPLVRRRRSARRLEGGAQ